MNPEANDPLDRLLQTRRAMSPPAGFAERLLEELHFSSVPTARPTFLSEYGVQSGLAVAVLGIAQAVNHRAVASVFDAALQAPGVQLAVAVVAICLGWVLTRQGPETEAL